MGGGELQTFNHKRLFLEPPMYWKGGVQGGGGGEGKGLGVNPAGGGQVIAVSRK